MKRYIKSTEQFGSDKQLEYVYMGPVWRFSKAEYPKINDWYVTVRAISKAQAITYIKFKAKQQLKLVNNAKITIDENKVYCIGEPPRRCPKCNSLLNDAGECLVCDLGVEDLE